MRYQLLGNTGLRVSELFLGTMAYGHPDDGLAGQDARRVLAGPRTVEQLDDNLAALDLTLPADTVDRLEAATGFTIGFPSDFIAEVEPSVFGDMSERVLGH